MVDNYRKLVNYRDIIDDTYCVCMTIHIGKEWEYHLMWVKQSYPRVITILIGGMEIPFPIVWFMALCLTTLLDIMGISYTYWFLGHMSPANW